MSEDTAVYCLTCSGHLKPGHVCPALHECRECQGLFRTAIFGPEVAERLERERLCFPCLRWTDAVALASRSESVRIAGRHYMIGREDAPEREPRGFLGQRFVIRFDSGKVVETTNLWSQGEIPGHFRQRLPDNATWEVYPW